MHQSCCGSLTHTIILSHPLWFWAVFVPWGSLRVTQHTPSSPGHSPPSIQVLNHPTPVWPRQGQASFSTSPGNRIGHNFWLKAGDVSRYCRKIELLCQSLRGKVVRSAERPATKNGKLKRPTRKTTTSSAEGPNQCHSFKRR